MSVPWYLMAKGKGGGYKIASGPIVSINDALAAPLRSLLVNIDPVQAGTGDPSPDNVRPISGWSAVNVWRTGKNLLSSAIGRYNWSGGVRYDNIGGAYCATEGKVSICGGQTYIASFNNTDTTQAVYFAWFNGDTFLENSSAYSAPWKATAPTNADGVAISIRNVNNYTGNPSVSNVQLELGSTATPYEPYSGNQYTLQLGQTVYGGTLDVTNGVLTVDRAMVDLGTISWTKGSSANPNLFYYQSPNYHWKYLGNLVCEVFKGVKQSNFNNVNDGEISLGNSAAVPVLYVRCNQYSENTAAEFKTAMSGVQLVYELAIPITIQLTPQEISTLQGENNLWADSGDVTVEYLSSGGADPDLMKLAVAFMGRK